MHRVLQHVDDHLDQSLELDRLASVANFSSFHFHRLFTADFAGSGPYHKTVLPGGKYAVGHFNGDDRAVGEAWTWMLRDWLPASGL